MGEMLRVTDTAGTSGSVTVTRHDVADAITPWYPDAPEEVRQAIDNLQRALNRDEDAGGWATFLGIEVERVDETSV